MVNISIHYKQGKKERTPQDRHKKVARKMVSKIWTVYTFLTTPTREDHVRRMSR